MNKRTLIWLVVAAGTLAGAVAMRPVQIEQKPYHDVGELLFEKLTDPTLATSLEVQGWDDKQAQLVGFKVQMQEGAWVIPSHHNYPADGVERMGRAAASLVDVRKDIFQGDNVADHGSCGVKSPDATDAAKDERGQRLILKDASGGVLADVIVGKPVPGKPGFRYLRLANSNRVYASKLALDLSTRFGDWIEKDLLHIEPAQISEVESNAYSVDERNGKIRNSKPVLFVRTDAQSDWKASDKAPAPRGKEADSAAIQSLVDAVDRLQIVGVRPQPAQLNPISLQRMGFFVTPDGKLVGNDGQIAVVTQDGLVYSLFFGEVTDLEGRALTSGIGAPKDKDSQDKAKKEAKGDNRFMFVTVSYDPSSDKSQAPNDPKVEKDSTAPDPKADKDKVPGPERAQKLAKRFSRWFYVISNASFEKIRKDPKSFFKKPDKSK